ncbi:unnamed protein product, partial [Adineta steineri]
TQSYYLHYLSTLTTMSKRACTPSSDDELAKLKGFNERDTQFFQGWCECFINPDHIDNPPRSYFIIQTILFNL